MTEKINKFGKVICETLNNGLRVFIIPKPGFNKYYCSMMTNFGSLFSKVKVGNEIINIPSGSAHFLEHKMFEMPDGSDASEFFASIGVESNAYTTYDITNYMIKGSTHLELALNYLLDFVQNPYFNNENVEKEKGIILQELYSSLDDPEYLIRKNVLNNMYQESRIKDDIVGNTDSINSITPDILNTIYNIFYQPSNMGLIIIGDVNVDEILKIINDNQSNKKFNKIDFELIEDKEENYVNKKYMEIEGNTSLNRVAIGIKFEKFNCKNQEIEDIHNKINMLLNLLIGKFSCNYQYMLDNELISSGFGYNSFLGQYINYYLIHTNTNNTEEYIKFMKKTLLNLKDFKPKEEDFISDKRSLLGEVIVAFDDFEFIGDEYLNGMLNKYDAFESFFNIQNITFKDILDIKDFLSNQLDEDHLSIVVYKNK